VKAGRRTVERVLGLLVRTQHAAVVVSFEQDAAGPCVEVGERQLARLLPLREAVRGQTKQLVRPSFDILRRSAYTRRADFCGLRVAARVDAPLEISHRLDLRCARRQNMVGAMDPLLLKDQTRWGQSHAAATERLPPIDCERGILTNRR
jgi:hypothetical protein